MSDSIPLPGGCNCGAVRYLVTRPFLFVYLCHCHLCQKRTGSAFNMAAVLPADGLRIVAGTLLTSERLLDNGERNMSWLCGTCHARIYTRRTGRSVISLRAGTLDDTSSLRPVAQFWTSSAQPWALVSNILSYAEQPTDFAPALAAWRAYSGQTDVR